MTIHELLEAARSGLERLSPAQARQAMRSGAALIDIRSDSQVAPDGRIAGALVIARNVRSGGWIRPATLAIRRRRG